MKSDADSFYPYAYKCDHDDDIPDHDFPSFPMGVVILTQIASIQMRICHIRIEQYLLFKKAYD